MVCNIEDLKVSCATILQAVDSSRVGQHTDTLEMRVTDGYLYLSVTDKESYVRVRVCPCSDSGFHVTVNATTFLQLISKISSDTIKFTQTDRILCITANGKYKIPIIYDEDKILSLPEIKLNNIVDTFNVDVSALHSMVKYNSKQLGVGVLNNVIQRLYYFDNQGSLTFTSGACVNKFVLNSNNSVKLLFNDRLVKLFKLFKEGLVSLEIARDSISEEIVQTKVRFTSADVEISCILYCDDNLLNMFPVDKIRNLASQSCKYDISILRYDLIESIERLLVFAEDKDFFAASEIEFDNDKLTLRFEDNVETISINYSTTAVPTEPYQTMISLKDFKQILTALVANNISIDFGNEQCLIIRFGQISFIIPEIRGM